MPTTGADALVRDWTPWPPGLVLVVLVVAPYATWWWRARRRGHRWSAGRSVLYLALGAGTLAYAVCGPLQVLRGDVYWVAALQVGVLGCLTPVGLALGDPLRLRALAHGQTGVGRPHGVLGGVLRVLMFPAVSSLVAVASITVVFFTPYLLASLASTTVEVVLVLQLLVTGLFVVLPLLVAELLPRWATPGVRALVAFVDGLADAVPGVALLSTATVVAPAYPGFTGPGAPADLLFEQHLAGGALLAVSEVVGLPVLAAVLIEWVRADRREAAAVDADLDAAEGQAQEDAPALWWRSDPRFAGRYRPAPDDAGGGQNTL